MSKPTKEEYEAFCEQLHRGASVWNDTGSAQALPGRDEEGRGGAQKDRGLARRRRAEAHLCGGG